MTNPYIRFASSVPNQREQATPEQVKNNAGGFVFQVSDATMLERFLILGTTSGTYYQDEKSLTKQNVDEVVRLITTNPFLVISTLASITTERRALRQSPAIFALALLFANVKNFGFANETEKENVYKAARDLVSVVCKTATHLFEFIAYIESLQEGGRTGWSPAKYKAVASWYQTKSVSDLAYQMAKYRSRSFGGDTITHADALRLAHAKIDEVLARFVGRWYKAEQNMGLIVDERPELDVIRAYLAAKESDVKGILRLMDEPYARALSWEMLPTEVLKSPEIWKKLFANGQLRNQALIRNVTRMSRIGAFNDMNFARAYADKLVTEATGLHPLNFLNAYLVHLDGQIQRDPMKNGYGRRTKDWTSVAVITDALMTGYYEAFKKVTPSGKRIMLALDVSGSMSSEASSGLDMTCAQLCGAMAMAIARVENNYIIKGFTSKSGSYGRRDTELTDLGISATTDLRTAFSNVQKNNFGATDCALPMLWALENRVEIDTFVVLTDNETWHGDVHPYKALEKYRQKMGINAGQIVVAATATPFTIANPNDLKTLDVVGGDANLPKLVSEFC